jgi:acyl dehydratase
MQKGGIQYDSVEVGTILGSSVNFATKEAIADYADAIEDFDPIFRDEQQALKAGYKKIIAPPGFHIQYTGMKWAIGQDKYVPQGSVHVKQLYEIFQLVYEGDCLTTIVSIADKYEKKGRKYLVYKAAVTNQHGDIVAVNEMTNILAE